MGRHAVAWGGQRKWRAKTVTEGSRGSRSMAKDDCGCGVAERCCQPSIVVVGTRRLVTAKAFPGVVIVAVAVVSDEAALYVSLEDIQRRKALVSWVENRHAVPR